MFWLGVQINNKID